MILYREKKYKYYTARNLFGSEANRINYLLRLGIYVSMDGFLFIRYRDRNKRKNIYHRYGTIAKAIYSQTQIVQDYAGTPEKEGELSFFNNLESDLQKITSGYQIWNQLSDETKKSNSDIIENILKMLQNNRLMLKKEILKLIKKLDSPKDSLNRVNPGAKKAIAVSAKDKSKKRMSQIDSSIELANKRRLALQIEDQYMQKNLMSATIRFGLLNLALKDGPPRDLKQQVGRIQHLLQSVWLMPYKKEAEQLKKLILNLK